MGTAFVPPPVSSDQGPASGFVPPPLSSHQGPDPDYSPSDAKDDFGSYLSQVVSGLWNTAKGIVGTAAAAGTVAADPFNLTGQRNPALQTLKQNVVDPQVQQWQKAKNAWNGGSPVEAGGHALAAALPGIGPAAANIGEKAGNQDWTGAAADATTLGITAAAPYIGGKVAAGGSALASRLWNLDPDTALWQALQPRTSAADFMKAGPTMRGDIKLAAGDSSLTTVPEVKQAVGAAKAINRSVLDFHLDPYRQSGATLPGNPIGDAIDATIPQSLQIEAQTDPAAAQRIQQIHQTAQSYRQYNFSVDNLRDLAIETNGDLNSFFHKTGDAQNAAIAQQGGVAVLEAKAAAIRQMMRDRFGPDVADIQQRWGWLDDADAGLDAAHKRMLNERATPVDVITNAPGKALHGDVTGARQSIRGKTNSLLKMSFDQTDPGMPLPTPQGGPGIGGMPNAIPPARQLPAAPGALPPPGTPPPRYSGTTGQMPPAWQANQWQNIGGQRALPPGSAGPQDFSQPAIVTPPPADASSVRSAPGMTAPPNPSRELPPARTFIVPTAESSGIHPTTGTPPTGPTYGVTPQSLAVKRGKWIWSALGGPGGGQ